MFSTLVNIHLHRTRHPYYLSLHTLPIDVCASVLGLLSKVICTNSLLSATSSDNGTVGMLDSVSRDGFLHDLY